jgi:hypothetical protein
LVLRSLLLVRRAPSSLFAGAEAAATLGRSSSESSRIANAFLLACFQKFIDIDVRND